MRSRNGTRSLLFAVCSLILIPLIRADEYIIGYRAVTQNAALLNESLTVSHAMTPCPGTPSETLFLNTSEPIRPADLKSLIEEHRDLFFGFVETQGVHIRNFGEHGGAMPADRIVLTLPLRCFTVDFNEDFVKISALK